MAKVVCVVSTKGGVGKTVTAIHLAAYFTSFGKTLLVDGDATRSATLWSKPGKLPFKVIPERRLSMELSETRYDFLVVDTEANPTDTDLSELATGCHLAVIPSNPDALGLHSRSPNSGTATTSSAQNTFQSAADHHSSQTQQRRRRSSRLPG